MAVRSGQLLFSGNSFIIDRLQMGGIQQVGIPTERIYEIGDYTTVALIRDIPDLSFQLDSYDMSTEIESMVFGGVAAADTDVSAPSTGTWFNFLNGLPVDVISPFRQAFNAYNIIDGVAIPHLYTESVAYKFAVQQSSSETWGLKGDSVYYIPGSPYLQQFTATSNQTVFTTAANVPIKFTEKGVDRYAYNVSVNGVRKFLTVDYTEAVVGSTLQVTFNSGLTTADVVRITYGGTTPNTSFPSTAGTAASTTVKPAAVRGRDVDIYVQVPGATPDMVRWDGVQSANFNWSVNLQADAEFGNYHYVTEDYVTPMVKGDITVKPSSVANLFSKIEQITNTTSSQTAGALTSQPLELECRVSIPDTSTVIKTLYTPDARFFPPAINMRVNTKLMPQFSWESDSGNFGVCAGTPTTDFLGHTI